MDELALVASSAGYIASGAASWPTSAGQAITIVTTQPNATQTTPRPLTDPHHIAGSTDDPAQHLHCEWDFVAE